MAHLFLFGLIFLGLLLYLALEELAGSLLGFQFHHLDVLFFYIIGADPGLENGMFEDWRDTDCPSEGADGLGGLFFLVCVYIDDSFLSNIYLQKIEIFNFVDFVLGVFAVFIVGSLLILGVHKEGP